MIMMPEFYHANAVRGKTYRKHGESAEKGEKCLSPAEVQEQVESQYLPRKNAFSIKCGKRGNCVLKGIGRAGAFGNLSQKRQQKLSGRDEEDRGENAEKNPKLPVVENEYGIEPDAEQSDNGPFLRHAYENTADVETIYFDNAACAEAERHETGHPE